MSSASSSTSPSQSASTLTSTSTSRSPQISVLFVCLGNICRSPMAEAVFRHLLTPASSSNSTNSRSKAEHHPLASIFGAIDSAGTGAYHAGSPPDSRTMKVLRDHGIKGYEHAARKVVASDFEEFDWIFAMDSDNYDDLLAMRKRALKKRPSLPAKVVLFGGWGGDESEEVIDPYYGADDGFEIAFEQMERFGKGFLRALGEDMVAED